MRYQNSTTAQQSPSHEQTVDVDPALVQISNGIAHKGTRATDTEPGHRPRHALQVPAKILATHADLGIDDSALTERQGRASTQHVHHVSVVHDRRNAVPVID